MPFILDQLMVQFSEELPSFRVAKRCFILLTQLIGFGRASNATSGEVSGSEKQNA
jgi:hypothetical protein